MQTTGPDVALKKLCDESTHGAFIDAVQPAVPPKLDGWFLQSFFFTEIRPH